MSESAIFQVLPTSPGGFVALAVGLVSLLDFSNVESS